MNIEKICLDFGIKRDYLDSNDIVFLPENIEETSKGELIEPSDVANIVKTLKKKKIKCAGAFNLGLEPKILDRKSNEIWLGVIYILEVGVIPLLISILGGLIVKDAIASTPKIHAKIRIKKGEEIKSLDYEGDLEGLKYGLDKL